MQIKQVWELTNAAVQSVLGETAVLNQDLSNVVDIGTQVFNAEAVDRYVRSLINHIGKVIFVNRPYSGSVPSVLMDGWEFGSVLEKISIELPEAEVNESWELVNGASYDPNIFYQPKVTAKFFNKRVTFEIPMSFAEKQVKQSFSNAGQLNAFVAAIYTAIDNAMTLRMDSLIMQTINNMTAETLHAEYPAESYNESSGVRAVNLLYLYKQAFADDATINAMTAADCMYNPEFIRFAAKKMDDYSFRLAKYSRLFNVGGMDRFTPADRLHVVMLSEFKSSANIYLQSDTFNEKYTALPNAEVVPYWQGSGTDYGFASTGAIHVNTTSNNEVVASGILCVMFDTYALGVTNMDRRVPTNYNAKAEFVTNFFKYDAGYYNDLNENFVVFFVA